MSTERIRCSSSELFSDWILFILKTQISIFHFWKSNSLLKNEHLIDNSEISDQASLLHNDVPVFETNPKSSVYEFTHNNLH